MNLYDYAKRVLKTALKIAPKSYKYRGEYIFNLSYNLIFYKSILKRITIEKIEKHSDLNFLNSLFAINLKEDNVYLQQYSNSLSYYQQFLEEQYILRGIDILRLSDIFETLENCENLLNIFNPKEAQLIEELKERLPNTIDYCGSGNELYIDCLYKSGQLVNYIKNQKNIKPSILLYLKNENIDSDTMKEILHFIEQQIKNKNYHCLNIVKESETIAHYVKEKIGFIASVNIQNPYENTPKEKYEDSIMNFIHLMQDSSPTFAFLCKIAVKFIFIKILLLMCFLTFMCFFQWIKDIIIRFKLRNFTKDKLMAQQNKVIADKLMQQRNFLHLALIKYEYLFSAKAHKEIEKYYNELKDLSKNIYCDININHDIVSHFEREKLMNCIKALQIKPKTLKI